MQHTLSGISGTKIWKLHFEAVPDLVHYSAANINSIAVLVDLLKFKIRKSILGQSLLFCLLIIDGPKQNNKSSFKNYIFTNFPSLTHS